MLVGAVMLDGDEFRIHLHVQPVGGDFRRDVAFRDALRDDPELKRQYTELKTNITGGTTVDAFRYTHSKTTWILGVYKALEKSSAELEAGLREAASEAGVPTTINRVGSMFTTFFTDRRVTDFSSAKTSDTTRFGNFFRAMLKHGVNLAPSQFEAAFLSLAHTKADIAKTVEAARKSLKNL